MSLQLEKRPPDTVLYECRSLCLIGDGQVGSTLAGQAAHTTHSPTDMALRCGPPMQPFVASAKTANHQTAAMRT